MGIRSDDDESFAHPSGRKRLKESYLTAIDVALKTGSVDVPSHVASELLRVYREAMLRDTEDCSRVPFFDD